MVDREELPGGAVRVKTALGGILISTPAPHVVAHCWKGHAEGELFPVVLAHLQQTLEKTPKVYIFAEFEPSETFSYDTELRNHWATWFKENRGRLVQVYMRISSPLLKLAAMMINLVSGDVITLVSDQAEFERLKAQAVRTPPG
ncbi:MAG TPA: hypothetical protein VK447_20935 [Myxococcaceae bacterium]|nr:hypothetical protein [Myxococcaceae bacterium]